MAYWPREPTVRKMMFEPAIKEPFVVLEKLYKLQFTGIVNVNADAPCENGSGVIVNLPWRVVVLVLVPVLVMPIP